jgi:hypothetical protein
MQTARTLADSPQAFAVRLEAYWRMLAASLLIAVLTLQILLRRGWIEEFGTEFTFHSHPLNFFCAL